jgi:hypothetical protein
MTEGPAGLLQPSITVMVTDLSQAINIDEVLVVAIEAMYDIYTVHIRC